MFWRNEFAACPFGGAPGLLGRNPALGETQTLMARRIHGNLRLIELKISPTSPEAGRCLGLRN